jgi:hypothetical protein
MKMLLLTGAAFAVAALAMMQTTQPASAVRTWSYWPNAGYCPAGTCNSAGGWKARNVSICSAANCRPYRRPYR